MSVWHAFGATWRAILGSRTLVSTLLLAVGLYAVYYPAPYAHQVAQQLPVVVVDEDDSALSRQLIRDLEATRAIHVIERAPGLAEGRARMRRGDADGVFLIARGLERQLHTGAPGAGIAIWLNAGYLLRASTIGDAVTAAVRHRAAMTLEDTGQFARAGLGIAIVREPLFNRTGGYAGYVFPAVAVVIAQQTLLFGAATFVGGRRRTGRGPERMAPAEYLGAWAAFSSVGLLSCLFLFGWIFWLQGMPRAVNVPAMLVAVPALSTAVAALGLWLGSFFDRSERAMVILAPTSAPVFFLSGTAWPLDQMPAGVRVLAHLIPSTAGVHVFVPLNQMGASLAAVTPGLGGLLGLAGLYGTLGWLRLVDRAATRAIS